MLFSNLGNCILPHAPHKDEVAFVDTSTDPHRSFTVADLNRLADAFADRLSTFGITTNTKVAICGKNRVEYVLSYLGLMRLGAVAVPINHQLGADVLEHILTDSECAFIIADHPDDYPFDDSRPVITFDELMSQAENIKATVQFASFDTSEETDAEILYTSGSTGFPKGVPLTHHGQCWALSRFLESAAKGPTYHSTIVAAPLYHMNGLFFTTFCLAQGIKIISMPKFDAATYVDLIAQYQCDYLSGVPTMFSLIAGLRPDVLNKNLDHVQRIHMGSAPLSQSLLDQLGNTFKNAEFSNGYGSTEAGPCIFGPHPDGHATPETSLGYPLSEIEWRFSNGDDQEGPFELRTPALTNGYLNRPDANEKQFTADGWYRSNDIMCRDELGFFYFVGREDDMFVCGGENIFPGQVEKIIEKHPDITQSAVIPFAHATKGMAPAAFVVVRDAGTAPSEDDIKAHCIDIGPAYAHPRHVLILPELPLGGTKKVDKHQLKGLLEEYLQKKSA